VPPKGRTLLKGGDPTRGEKEKKVFLQNHGERERMKRTRVVLKKGSKKKKREQAFKIRVKRKSEKMRRGKMVAQPEKEREGRLNRCQKNKKMILPNGGSAGTRYMKSFLGKNLFAKGR